MQPRGFRVTDNDRSKKVGVAAADFASFKEKTCLKLNKCPKKSKFYVAECGTLIGDAEYFDTLKSQTLVVVIDDDQIVRTELELEFEKILPTDYLKMADLVLDFFNKNPDQMRNFLKKVKYNVSLKENKTHLSKKGDHEDWFIGIEKYNSKEEFMSSRAQSRIKSYLARVKVPINKRDEFLDRHDPAHEKIKQFWSELEKKLKKQNYCGHYFNRLVSDKDVFCDVTGNFSCQGKWNSERCADGEFINPYNSREERTIFKSWNLDHQIELSRSIVPSILKAIIALREGNFVCYKCNKKAENGFIASDPYYQLLFTRKNLKLVSEICHDKKRHDEFTNVYLICKACKIN